MYTRLLQLGAPLLFERLILNLSNLLKNPSVQGMVVVSDPTQIGTANKHPAGAPGHREKLKCWDYPEMLQVHQTLCQADEAIIVLGLVSQGF